MATDSRIRDIRLAPAGREKIEWVAPRMKVLDKLCTRFQKSGAFKNATVAVSIHLEAKTAYFCLVLKRLGASVWVSGSNPFSTKDEIAAALAEAGLHVFAYHGTDERTHRAELHAVLESRPHVVLDDGGDLCDLLHAVPTASPRLKGICEETTTGVARARGLAAANKLRYPVIAVNDARSKYLFDNRYGTGQSTWTAITHLTNMNIAGRTVVVVGYGWVGRGVALRARGLGANVIVTEVDPWKALEAQMDGYAVKPIEAACKDGHFFITATGAAGVIGKEHFRRMGNGAVLANAGHIDGEINMRDLQRVAKSKRQVRAEVFEYVLARGTKLYVLADGRIVNIAGGLGHPVEIMDMSFSLQLACLHHLLASAQMKPAVYEVSAEVDEMIVREKLAAEGIEIDTAK